ncbi:transposable element Tc1 transposase [Trichonephila clavipes]|nr:transposable element Tc1 transposase [Trichonephila clavipes]
MPNIIDSPDMGLRTVLQSRCPKRNDYSTLTGIVVQRSGQQCLLQGADNKIGKEREGFAYELRAWQADWHQIVFSDESRFNLWDHDGRIRVRRCAGERCLSECVIEQHSALTPGVMVWGAISYHGRSNLRQIEGNLNSNRYVREVLQPEVVPFL